MVKTHCVAKAVLLDNSDNFLLLTRSDTHPRLAGFYDLPGGTIESHESAREAVIREVMEEAGIELPNDKVSLLYTTTKLLHGKSYPTLLYLARVDEEKPEVKISWEHKDYEWAPLDRLSEVEPQLAPTYREALDYIRLHSIIEDINAE